MPLVPSGLNATLLCSSERDRALESSHGHLCASATLLCHQLGSPAKPARSGTLPRELVGNASSDRHYRERRAHFIRNRDIDGSAMAVEIECTAAIEPARESHVAGDRLYLGPLEYAISAVDPDRSAHRREGRVLARSLERDCPTRALGPDPRRRARDVDVSVDRFGIQLTRIARDVDRSTHHVQDRGRPRHR